jgi:hypothetical protein
MSTGADCQFIEREPGVWYYRLQRWPYGDSPDYGEYGPFPSERAADRHLSENHANPGGYTVQRFEKRCVKCSARLDDPQLAATEDERCEACADPS